MGTIKICFAAVSLSLATAVALAHHSYTEYDNTTIVEIKGKLLVADWQNPHSHLEVEGLDANNRVILWDIESGPLNGLRRRQLPLEIFKAGDVVSVAGWQSKRFSDHLYATNLLSSDGQEVLLQSSEPRWKNLELIADRPLVSTSSPESVNSPTLFRVWSSDPDIDPETRNGFLGRAQVSLTEKAKQAVVSFNPISQSTTSGCTPKGMPILMGQPFPIQFEDQGDSILLLLEEYDTIRTIHMVGAIPSSQQESTPLGFSVGHWEGATLVVDTARIDTPYFNSSGIPLSRSAHTLERFSVSEDGSRLSYALTVTDPENFTEPAQATRAWLARSGESLLPYDCRTPVSP